MIRKLTRKKVAAIVSIPASLVITRAVWAQTSTWTGAGSDNLWTDTSNWDTGFVPVSGSTAAFTDIGNGNTSISLGGAAQPINTILFEGTNTSYTLGVLSSGDAFTFDSLGGITVNSSVAASETINANINTTGSMIVTNNSSSGRALTLGGNVTINNGGVLLFTGTNINTTTTINGNISDANGTGSVGYLFNTGSTTTSMTLTINGFNTYSGTTALQVVTGNAGAIQIGTDSPFGTNKVFIYLGSASGINSPLFQALNGTRTLSNAIDFNGGITFAPGSYGFTFTGPLNVINTPNAGRTFNNCASATVTFGSATNPSTINLGNPVSNGGSGFGNQGVFDVSASGGGIVINDVMQNPSGTGSGTVSYAVVSGGTITINSLNTYSGTTTINSATGGAIQFDNSYVAGGTSGPFGTGPILFNNSSNPSLEPMNGNQTLANTLTLSTGFTVANAGTDTSSLTFTGPMALQVNGRTITNNFGPAATLTLGSATNPSTITLATPSTNAVQTLVFAGPGYTVINDTFQNSGTNHSNLNFNSGASGTVVINGALNIAGSSIQMSGVTSGAAVGLDVLNVPFSGSGSMTISGSGIVDLNAPNTYTGGTILSGASTIIPIQFSSTGTSGVFGTGLLTFNNGANQHLRPVGNQTIGNAVSMATGFAMENTTGDTSNLTFSGPIALQTTGRFISNGFSVTNGLGGTLFIGAATSPSTLTLATTASQTLSFAALNGPIVINDVIQNGTGGPGNVAINPNVNDLLSVEFASQNIYTGNTTIGAGTNNNGGGITLVAVSSVTSGTSITSGPFGTGTLIFNQIGNQGSQTAVITPIGASQTVANPVTLNSGFVAANSGSAAFNLTFTGAVSMGTNSAIITNNMVTGTALTLGSAGTAATTMTLATTLQLQSLITSGPTVINDLVQDNGTNFGSILVGGGTVQLANAGDTYSGGTLLNGGVLSVAADGALGNASGTVALTGGTLLSTATFTSARGITLNSGTTTNTIDATGTNVLTLTGAVSGSGDLTKGTNSGTLQLAQSAGFSIAGNINVNGGTLLVGPTGGETGPLSVGNTLTVNSGALAAIATGVSSNSVTNSVSTLTLNGSGQFDLANSNLITSTPSNTIRQYLINGYNGGAWNGTGGISSVNANASYNIPASNGGHFTALGYTSGTSTVGAALGLTAGQTLVKYTIYGDANLDGTVDINDLNIVLSNFLSGNPATWDTGDFFYAGQTDISDLNAVLSNFFDTAPTTVRAANAAAKFKASTASTAKTLTGTVSPADTVSPPPANGVLELVVNTTSGDVELEGNNADIASLQITSASSSIITANWTDLHANGYTNWSDTAKKKTGIGEYDNQFTATGDYAVLGVVDYGDIYNTTVNAEDYVFKYGSVESNDTTVDTDTGSVIYVSGVPEPTTLSLLGLAAAGLMGRRRKSKQPR